MFQEKQFNTTPLNLNYLWSDLHYLEMDKKIINKRIIPNDYEYKYMASILTDLAIFYHRLFEEKIPKNQYNIIINRDCRREKFDIKTLRK